MRIQHNIAAMNAYRNYNVNANSLNKNLEKLSSGYKINRAGDDAAGLAISEKMRAQITGLETASKNVKDGISLVKTAEGALQEVHDMLNRMEELATQSANGTYDNDVDRNNLQKEVEALKSEINRIADSTNFNGIKLLNGDWSDTKELASSTHGVMDPSEVVDGTDRTQAAAGATATITFGNGQTTSVAAKNKEAVTGTSTVGKDPQDAQKLTIDFAIKATPANTETVAGVAVNTTNDYQALLNVAVGGKTLGDYFDIEVNGAAATPTDVIAGGDTIKLIAKNAGDLSGGDITTLKNLLTTTSSTALDADATVTDGNNTGDTLSATGAEYTLSFDLDKLGGGDKFTINNTTYEIVSDPAEGTANGAQLANGNTAIVITGLSDLDKATNIQAAISGSAPTGTTASAVPAVGVNGYDNVNGTYKLTFTVDDPTENDDFNVGTFGYSEELTDGSAIGFSQTDPGSAGTGGVGTAATATYSMAKSDLVAGSSLEFKSADGRTLTINIVDDTTGTTGLDTTAANTYNIKAGALNDTNLDTALTALNAGFTVNYTANVTDNTKMDLTFTHPDKMAQSSNWHNTAIDLKLSTTGSTTGSNDVLNGGLTLPNGKIELGTTQLKDLLNIKVDGQKLSDLFTIEYDADGTGNGAAVAVGSSTTGTIAANSQIKLTAKLGGKQTADILNALKSGNWSGATAQIQNGNNEGSTSSANSRTTYELNFKKLAGGQSFSINNTTFKVCTSEEDVAGVGADEIALDLTGVDQSDNAAKMNAIKSAITNAASNHAWLADFDVDVDVSVDSTTGTPNSKLILTAKSGTEATNLGDITVALKDQADIEKNYVTFDGNADAMNGTYASVTYDWENNVDSLRAGDTIKIGDTTLTLVDGAAKTGEISVADAADADKVVNAMLAAGYKGAALSAADGKITVTNLEMGSVVDSNGDNTLETGAGKLEVTAERDTSKITGTPLKLQIGDSSDGFNQLKLFIKDIGTDALKISDLNISTLDDASDSINMIKDAINYVSSVRGDLGAAQNRLEHTANNLSVMTENIQDAESTIRDTDVAAEMMQYTKNNILLQSAQAMLAQANQLPQGVLQLLG